MSALELPITPSNEPIYRGDVDDWSVTVDGAPLDPRRDLVDHSAVGFDWGGCRHLPDERRWNTRYHRAIRKQIQAVQIVRFDGHMKDVKVHSQRAGHACFLGDVGLQLDGGVDEYAVVLLGGDEVDEELIAVATEVVDLGEAEFGQDVIASKNLSPAAMGAGLANIEATRFSGTPNFPLEPKPSAFNGVVLIGAPAVVAGPIAERMLPRATFWLCIAGLLSDADAALVADQLNHRLPSYRAVLYIHPASDGRAQLALAILAHHLDDDDRAVELHQAFKDQVIGRLRGSTGFALPTSYIAGWVAGKALFPGVTARTRARQQR